MQGLLGAACAAGVAVVAAASASSCIIEMRACHLTVFRVLDVLVRRLRALAASGRIFHAWGLLSGDAAMPVSAPHGRGMAVRASKPTPANLADRATQRQGQGSVGECSPASRRHPTGARLRLDAGERTMAAVVLLLGDRIRTRTGVSRWLSLPGHRARLADSATPKRDDGDGERTFGWILSGQP